MFDTTICKQTEKNNIIKIWIVWSLQYLTDKLPLHEFTVRSLFSRLFFNNTDKEPVMFLSDGPVTCRLEIILFSK